MAVASLMALSTLLAAGCLATFHGDDPAPPHGSGGDAGTSSGDGASTGDLGSASVRDLATATSGDLGGSAGSDLAIACDPLRSTGGLSSPSGQHNAGQECQGCHAPGGAAPTFYLAGTLYDAATGGGAVAGATIHVTDANGKKVDIVSANNGNFWTTTTLAFPVKVAASLCPAAVPMVATVGGNGACNNCHNGSMRVHVP